MKISIEKKSLVGFGLATAVLVSINALSYWSLNKNRETAKWVTHTYQVQQNIESTLADIKEAEAAQRGYVITGQESYLQSYYESVASIRQQIRDVQTLTADNPNQQQRISILKPLVEQRVATFWEVIDLRRGEGFDAAQASIKTGQGTQIMTRIRQVLNEMEDEEANLLKQRVSQQEAAIKTQNIVFSIGIVFNLLVFYWLYRAISREIAQRRQAQAALQKVNTELSKANAALAERETLLRLFIENVPVAIAMFDREMRYLATSQLWLQDYQVSEQDIIGRSHYEVFPEMTDRWRALHQRCLLGVTAKFEEDCYSRPDGTLNWERREIHPWHNSAGEVSGIVIFTENITNRKEAEEKLRLLNAELARSNTELEQFAYVASHDLREPLRKIKSYTELLAEDYQSQFDEKANKYMAYITDGAARMQALITDLLTYSRVGKGELSVEPTNLEAVVNQAIEDLSLTIQENDAQITVKPLPTVKANPERMAQLFQNLIANALKYRGEAPPLILIQSELKDEQWVISIQDNGIGIKPQYFERIFVIFQRLHGREKYSGTGIGLAICRKIVERHGGRLWVESELGSGTTFFFTLPAH